jgi:RNA polymerase sigma-70 factor (ECF subfamily)
MNLPEFKEKVYPLQHKLFRFAKRMLEQAEEAEDVVQDAFVRLWNKRDRLDEYRSVEALAMITTKNLCLDRIKSRRHPVENIDNHRIFVESLPGEPAHDHSEMVQNIRQAIDRLPDVQRMIVHLRDIEGYEFSEIAAVVDMNENAIRVALSRARKRIRDMVIKQHAYEYHGN